VSALWAVRRCLDGWWGLIVATLAALLALVLLG
jgi:hypothetical protein